MDDNSPPIEGGVAQEQRVYPQLTPGILALPQLFAVYSPQMGGERESTTRQRLAGEICCVCKVGLKPETNQRPGERYCDRCAPKRKVYMYFMLAKTGWCCQFLEEDLKTPLPKKLTFATPDKVVKLAERAGALSDQACRQAIEHGIEIGRGGVFLKLSPEQYAKLKLISVARSAQP